MKNEIYASSSFVKNPITGRSLDTHFLDFIDDVVQERITSLDYNRTGL
jgi:hypothetical protein